MSLAELFFRRERLRRRARDVARARLARRRSPLVFEPLEGRLLLSADVSVLNDVLLSPALVEPLEPTPTAALTDASPVNVDSLVDVTLSGLILDRTTGTFDSRATITNVSAETLQSPMRLVVTSIASAGGVTLANADGQTEDGDAFVEVTLPDGGLVPGASVDDIVLAFADPLRARFTFTTSVEAVPETGDKEAPDVSAALANDTGRDETDGITFDPTVSGTVTDAGAVTSFQASLDDGVFTDVLPSLGPGGAFTLDAADLAAINKGPLADDAHTLHLVATDAAGNTSPILNVSFTLDTKAPAAPAFDLDPDSDTPPAGDQQTTLAAVDLAGQTEAGAEVTLLETSDVTPADGAGLFTFGNVALALGANPFTARAADLAGNQSEFTLTLTRLAAAAVPFTVAEHTPLDGADAVAIGVHPKIVFSEAVDPTTLTGATFFATAGGTALPATVVVDPSGLFARLFFSGPMPGGAAAHVTVDGSAIRAAADGEELDADGDGVPGGVLTFDFTTLSTVALPGTTLSGRLADAGPDLIPLTGDDTLPGLDGKLGTADDLVLTPVVGARIFVRGLEDDFVLTGADGSFHFDAVPGGPVTLALRGETAAAPAGFTYPELTADVRMTVGADNVLGTIYMPRLASDVVQTVNTSATTLLTLPPGGAFGLTEEQRQQFTLEIPAGGLLGPDGQPVATAQVVMSVVPPGTLAPFLPPALPAPTFAFTTQLRGATDLAAPFRATFPNVSGAAAGTEFMVLSFDPATGHLVQDGTATVVAREASPLRATDRAAGVVAQQDPEGELVITWSPSPLNALAACFHLLVPNMGPIGPPCPPVSATIEVPPIPVFSGLNNQLFTRDDGLFSLSFANAAQPIAPTAAPCAIINVQATPLVVDIHVDGPAGAFLEGLESMSFVLLPGQTEQLEVDMKDFAPLLKTLTADQLYAVNVHVTAFASNDPGTLLEDQTFAIARYVPVVDPAGEVAVFLKTLGDGPGGMVRGKQVDYHLPVEVDTTITDGDPVMILDRDGPLFGEGTTTWLFDPVATTARSTRIANATFTVGQQALPQSLRVQGTVVAPTTISPNRDDFEALLTAFLDESRHFTPTPGFLLATQAFIDEFRDGIPFFNGGSLTPEQLAAREQKIHETGQQLVEAVRADFAPANGSFSGYRVVDNGGDVAITWQPLVPGPTGPVFGVADERDADRDRLQQVLPDPNLPDVAKEWVFAEELNQQAANSMTLSFDLHAHEWNNKTTFPIFVALTPSHELGHTFGLNEAYLKKPGSPAVDLPPNDIMRSGDPNDPDLKFADVNVDTLRAAIGLAPDAPGALASAIQMYRKNFNLFVNTVGIRDVEPGGDAVPALGVSIGNDDLFAGDLLAAGTVLADGSGGAATTRTLTLTNAGLAPLTIGALAFAGGSAGFLLTGPSPTGTVLDIGESVTVGLVFDPTSAGAFTDTLSIESDAPGDPFTLALAGDGLTAGGRIATELARDPRTGAPVQNNVGGLALGAAPRTVDDLLTVRNTGGGPLTITAVGVTGESAAQFAVGGLPAGFGPGHPLVLAPGETFALDVTFDAAALGLQRAQIEIVSDDAETPVLRQTVVGTGLADQGSALEYGHDFVAVELLQQPDTPVVRTVSDTGGNWTFLLASDQSFHDAIFDPVSGLIAHGFGVTAPTGTETDILSPVFGASTAPDRDGDGLPDDVEFAVGTSVASVDSDADGVDDFAELRAGLDPLDSRGTPTGVIGGLGLDGEAWDIATVGSVAYVATGNHGLAIVDISEPGQPILLGSRDLTGSNVSVAVDGARGLAAVASHFVDPGLHIVDVSDPAHPVVQRSIALPDGARHVEVLAGVAYVASGTAVVAIELVSGDLLQTLDLGSTLTGLAREGETLFAMDGAGTLTAVDISGAQMAARDTLAVPDGGGEIFVGGGIAYLAAQGFRGGFATVDVSDPHNLTLISGSDVASGFRPEHAVAADGSGAALVIGDVPNPANPLLSIGVVDGADVSDPADTNAYFTRTFLPEFPLGITLASGVALIADGDADLLVVGYRPVDTAGHAPAVSISALVDDADPATPGIQVAPDSRIHLLVDATDDVLVRGVEILVNGQAVATDTSFPYEALLTASASGGPMTVQARATDTGGNVALSNTLVFEPATDTVAPTIVTIDPADGASAPEGLQQVTVRFSEALDAASVSASTFRVVTGGQTVAPLGIDLLSEGQQVQLRFAGLAAGDYQLVIDADAVTDVAGNALGTADVVSDFTLTGEAVTWVNPAGGFWDDPANWEGGVLPGPGDNVLIDVPGDVTITHRTGLTVINRLISRESLALTGGTLDVATTLQVDGAFTLSFTQGTGPTLRHAAVLPGAGGQDILITNFVTLDGVTLAADLTVTDLGTANVRNGLTLDSARVTLASDGGPTMLIFDSDQTLGGTGEVFFGGTANDNDVDVDGILTIGPGITIRGSQSGGVGHSFGNETIVLEGTVLAETAGETIVVDGNGWENRGLVRATNGGRLELDGTFTLEDGGTFSSASGGAMVLVGTLDNTGRTLALTAATGSLQVDGGTVQGGRIETTGGAALVPQGELILDGVTLGSDFAVPDGGAVLVRNGLTLDDITVTLLDGTVPFIGPRIRFDGTQMLGGSGDIVFGGTADDGTVVAGSGSTLTIGSGITIHGPRGGSVGVLGAVANQGTISAAVSGREIAVTGSSVTNAGTIEALNGGSILFAGGQFTNTGDVTVGAGSTARVLSGTYLQTAGETSLAGGTLWADTVSLQGGVLSGFGTVRGTVSVSLINAALVDLGAPTGTLQVNGTYQQTAAGTLNVGLGGTAAGQFDRLQITGAATLGGTLNVSLVGGFLPAVGNTFEILTFTSRTGDFATITGLALPNGNTLQYSPEATRIRLITTV